MTDEEKRKAALINEPYWNDVPEYNIYFRHPCGCQTWWYFLSKANQEDGTIPAQLTKIVECDLHAGEGKKVGHEENLVISYHYEEGDEKFNKDWTEKKDDPE